VYNFQAFAGQELMSFYKSTTIPIVSWRGRKDSNPQPSDPKSDALSS
ncbi:uncharacterized protein METZ01_LOCUS100039, partial [marine metagenome]